MADSDSGLESVLRRFEEAAAPLLRKSLAALEPAPDDAPLIQVRRLRALRRQQEEFSKGWSKFLFDHASDLNRIVRARAEFLPRALGRRLPPGPPPFGPPSFELQPFDRMRAEMMVIDRLFDLRHVKPNPCMGTQPAIYTTAHEWEARDTQAITGVGFGATAGSAVLELDTPRGGAFPPPGTTISLNVLDWADTAIRVDVPAVLPPGIPLAADAWLKLTRADVPCIDMVRVVFKPPRVFPEARSAVAAAAGAAAPGTPYSRDHVFTSPVLPPRAEPHVFGPSITPFGDVFAMLTHREFTYGDDDPPSVSASSGPSFTSNRARTITLNVRDDWAWNYSLQAVFTIVQPADEVIMPGWTVN